MSRPELSDEAARAAYRQELRGAPRWPRMVGLMFVFASLGLWAWPQNGGPLVLGPLPTETWGWICLAIGWAVLLGVIAQRMRHHRSRVRESEG